MNKNYNRWTERAKDGSPALITERIFYELGKLQGQIKKRYFTDSDVLDIVTRYLCDLEDKIENGTLIELPCKVGDIVYELEKDCSNCTCFKETGWEYDCWCDTDKVMFEVDGDDDCIYRIDEIEFEYNSIPKFGKSIFLTKAEAEAKLCELKGEGQ